MAKYSENTKLVVEYLQKTEGKNVTSHDVAEALGLTVSQVNGVFTALTNKKLGKRVPATVKGAVDITFIAGTGAERPDGLSESAVAILDYLADVDGDITINDAVEATGIAKRQFVGSFNSLVKKGLAKRIDAKVEGDIEVKYLQLTDDGMALEFSDEDAE